MHTLIASMTDAYRDDLEAALARASDLEREIEALRRRNAELEAEESSENARRLAAALEREREEMRIRDTQRNDDATWRRAASDVASTKPDADDLRHRGNAFLILVAGMLVALVAGVTNSPPLGAASFALFASGIVYLYQAESRARKRRQKGERP